MVSTVPIHFGRSGVSPAFGRFAQSRRARPSSTTPSTTLPHDVVSELLESVPTSAAWLSR